MDFEKEMEEMKCFKFNYEMHVLTFDGVGSYLDIMIRYLSSGVCN